MKKSTVIANCLVNSGFYRNIDDAENRVYGVFLDEFKGHDYNLWNTQINNSVAENIIRNVGRASTINVRRFIEDLWK